MATRKRRGLGSGLGALIPPEQAENTESPIDIFFGTVKKKDSGSPEAAGSRQHENSQQDEANPLDLGYGSAGENVSRETSGGSQRVASKPSATSSKKKVAGKKTQARSGAVDTSDGVVESPAAISEAKAGEVEGVKDNTVTEGAPVVEATGGATETGGTTATEGVAGTDAAQASNVSRETSEDDLVAVPGATYGEIDVNVIVPNRAQPRTNFDDDDLEELAQSIKEVGVLQPIVIRPLSEPLDKHPDARYELIMGERRWRATQRAGLTHIPAIIRRTSDEDLLRDALLENLHRADLNPLEEAAAYQQLLEDFQCTQDELAKRIARSRPQITNTLRLLKLPALVQRRVAAGVLSSGHARALLGLADAGAMERLAQRIVAEGLSVRAVEEIVALGDESTPASVRRVRVKRYENELTSVATQLGDRLNTRVKVDMGRTKGTMRIDFGSLEDLNRILAVLAPDITGVEIPEEGNNKE
ncbi:ParB/RepB/Spo0J family partition protein [Actinotignum schaalii]|uniref:ParB/RepB/Spo0J family partition protein n=1 Tax=Actinotignum schaalii TaxID=59505 RepID=UPI00042819B9|nr:ParB/RepB/Spo0J family partition protein [Actinotignum schaalii]AIE82967.1 chromosomal partitioning protein ParB [Actinotignum schaalii]WQN45109.1 ParB/RepB/Spo0J family partition protein [Actinotignum schaalii]